MTDSASVAANNGTQVCGDFMCDSAGNQVGLAPASVRSLSEDTTVELMIAGAAAKGMQAGSVLVDGAWWNSGQYFRIGFGRKGGVEVFRAAGNWFGKHWPGAPGSVRLLDLTWVHITASQTGTV